MSKSDSDSEDSDSEGPGKAGPYQEFSYESEDKDGDDYEEDELKVDFDKFDPRKKSWEEIKAHTGDDEWSEIDEYLQESFINQKNKITIQIKKHEKHFLIKSNYSTFCLKLCFFLLFCYFCFFCFLFVF